VEGVERTATTARRQHSKKPNLWNTGHRAARVTKLTDDSDIDRWFRILAQRYTGTVYEPGPIVPRPPKRRSARRARPKTDFKFRLGHRPGPASALRGLSQKERRIALQHNRMLSASYEYLTGQHGKDRVGTEINTGFGSKIDLVLQERNGLTFFEFKVGKPLQACIRDALGQLLEYAYYPKGQRAKKLVIVAPHGLDRNSQGFLNALRTRLKLPIYYRQYRTATHELDERER
jgi:glycosyltransferase involved in cell wall biosynthesis